jgi:serine/threonine-protein kinase
MTLGTPSYMPPEQYEDSRNVDKRADIYAMGVMLYEMTTGKKPFSNTFNAEAIRRIQQGKYTKPRKHNPKISAKTQRLIRRCMKAKPDRRFQTMAKVLQRVDRVLGKRVKESDVRIVADYLAGTGSPPKGPNRRRRAVIAIVAVAVVALAGAAGYGYYAGYHYEYLYPDEYGALQVAVRMPRGEKSPDEAYIAAQLFHDDGEEIPAVTDASVRFTLDPLQSTEETFVMRSQKLYLPAGAYRVKVMAEQDLVWRSLFLQPRSMQREGAIGEARRISVNALPPPALPLNLRFRATNRATGERISVPFEIDYRAGGRWVELTRELREDMRTGTVHRFRFRAEGFYREDYSLMVQPYQSDLLVEADLTPYPATVSLVGDLAGVEILVNDSRQYLRGGRQVELVSVPQPGGGSAGAGDEQARAAGGSVELTLLPGRHRVTLRRGGAEATEELRLDSQEHATLRVEYDTDSQELEVEGDDE